MLHRLAADLASGLAAAAAPAGGAHRGHHYRLPAGQISANGPAQPATAAGKHGRHDALRQRGEAALEAIACLLRPVLHQRDPAPSRREKQFQKIIALIDASIQSEHLRPEWLASETGMSVRSLYRLFADRGLVVAQYIKNRRLDLCARALQNVHDDEKLAGIGYRWGFSDHSHFSTAFKQRFGVTPGNTASAVANYLRSHWPFNPRTYSPGCARATSFCPAIFATSSTGRLLSSASCW